MEICLQESFFWCVACHISKGPRVDADLRNGTDSDLSLGFSFYLFFLGF